MTTTILIIEDEAAIADLVHAFLEEEGHRVVHAPNGREGLRLLREERVDLVISDVMMPVMDGRAFARTMRGEPAYDAIPLVLMSAGGRGVVDGVPHTAFLFKPFDVGTLTTLVTRLLPGAPR